MKSLKYSLFLVIFLSTIYGCGTTRPLPIPPAMGLVEIKTPFSEPEYRTDKDTYRATGVEFLEDEQSAKDAAYLSASSLIQLQIQQQLKTFNNRFAQAVNKNQAKDYESELNTFVNAYANDIIGDIKYISDKTFIDNTTSVTKYRVYCLVEKSRESIKNAYEKRLSNDDKLKVMFDRKKYLEEMKKFEDELQKN